MDEKQPPEMTLEEAEAILAQYRHDPDGPLYSVSYTFEAMNEMAQALHTIKRGQAKKR